MTAHALSIALQIAGILVLLFLIGLLLIVGRRLGRGQYHASPESRSTPLGYWSMEQNRRVTQGTPGQRAYVPGDERAETVKVSTLEGKR